MATTKGPKTLANSKGAGTITELLPGKRYRLRFVDPTLGVTDKGIRRQRCITFAGSAADARARLAVEMSKVGQTPRTGAAGVEAIAQAARRTVGDLLTAWLSNGQGDEEYGWSPQTVRTYEFKVARYLRPALGHIALADLDAYTVDMALTSWRNDGLSPRTRNSLVKVLGGALRQGERWGWCTTTAAKNARIAKVDAKVKPIPADDLRLILDEARKGPQVLRLFVELAAATGARRGEVLGLVWGDLVDGKITIRRSLTTTGIKEGGKTAAATRTIDLGDELVSYLESLRGTPGQPIVMLGPAGADKAWQRLCGRVGVSYHIHQVRHSVASRLISAGLDLVEVARVMGHADASITLKIYAKPESVAKSVAAHLTW